MPAGLFLLAILMLFSTSACSTAGFRQAGKAEHQPAAAPMPGFRVFDAIQHRNKPDLSRYGMEPIALLGTRALWGGRHAGDNIDLVSINQSLSRLPADTKVVCLDIEHWKLTDTEKASGNMARLSSVLALFQRRLPGREIGYYGLTPERNYWAPVKQDQQAMTQWQSHNRKVAPLADKADAVFPSLYTFYPNPEGWRKYALANIREARQYNKPVYVFLWPQFHDSNRRLKHQDLPRNFWRQQLELVKAHADGVVIWTPASARLEWQDDNPWWLETRDFLEKLSR